MQDAQLKNHCKNIFKFLLLVVMATRILHGMEIFGDHPRIIPMKFVDNPPSGLGLGGDVVESLSTKSHRFIDKYQGSH